MSRKDIEIGQLKSEIDRLQHELQLEQQQKEINKQARIEARKEELYRMQQERNKKLLKDNRVLRNRVSEMSAKIHVLQLQLKQWL